MDRMTVEFLTGPCASAQTRSSRHGDMTRQQRAQHVIVFLCLFYCGIFGRDRKPILCTTPDDQTRIWLSRRRTAFLVRTVFREELEGSALSTD